MIDINKTIETVDRVMEAAKLEGEKPYHPDWCPNSCHPKRGKLKVVYFGSSQGYIPLALRKAARDE